MWRTLSALHKAANLEHESSKYRIRRVKAMALVPNGLLYFILMTSWISRSLMSPVAKQHTAAFDEIARVNQNYGKVFHSHFLVIADVCFITRKILKVCEWSIVCRLVLRPTTVYLFPIGWLFESFGLRKLSDLWALIGFSEVPECNCFFPSKKKHSALSSDIIFS